MIEHIDRNRLNSILANITGRAKNRYKKSVDEKGIWITDGYVAFRFSQYDFPFNSDLFEEADFVKRLNIALEDDNKQESVIEYIKLEKASKFGPKRKDKYLAKLKSKDYFAYVNYDYMKIFKNCDFFLTGNKTAPVCAYSPNHNEPVGMICPVMVQDDV